MKEAAGGIWGEKPFPDETRFPWTWLCEKSMLGTVIPSRDHTGMSQVTSGHMENGELGEPK